MRWEYEFDQEVYERVLREDGEIIGFERGMEKGEACKLISLICKKIQKNKTPETIAEELEEEIAVIEPIYRIAKESGGFFDCGQIYEKLAEKDGKLSQTV